VVSCRLLAPDFDDGMLPHEAARASTAFEGPALVDLVGAQRLLLDVLGDVRNCGRCYRAGQRRKRLAVRGLQGRTGTVDRRC
jgi:hypothetical protein